MARGKRPDPRKKKTEHVHAQYLKVVGGTTEYGWSAGELYGCYGHRTYAHQPCVSSITDDEIPCPYCRSGMVPEFRAYVPVWDRDWCLRYCLIGEDYFASVEEIPHRAPIAISRAKNPISPLIVRALDKPMLTRELPARAPWSQPINMLSICLTLWKDQQLVEWFAAHPEPEEKPVRRADGKPFTPMMQAAARVNGFKPAPEVEPSAEQLRAPLERVMKRLSNGKHAKPAAS